VKRPRHEVDRLVLRVLEVAASRKDAGPIFNEVAFFNLPDASSLCGLEVNAAVNTRNEDQESFCG
jgi:hypothetical protein